MTIKIRVILFLLAISILMMPIVFAANRHEGVEIFGAADDDNLYFHSSASGLPPSNELEWAPVYIKLINMIKPTQDFFSHSTRGKAWFVTPPLVAEFIFTDITVNFYHDMATTTTNVNITIGWYDEWSHPHIVLSEEKPLVEGATNSSLTFSTNFAVQENERLLILVFVHAGSTWLDFYYDYKDHESGIQYSGNASYTPELTPGTLLLFFLSTIFVVYIIKRIRTPQRGFLR